MIADFEVCCSDCPPKGYPTDTTRCEECPRRKPMSDEVKKTSDGAPYTAAQYQRVWKALVQHRKKLALEAIEHRGDPNDVSCYFDDADAASLANAALRAFYAK